MLLFLWKGGGRGKGVQSLLKMNFGRMLGDEPSCGRSGVSMRTQIQGCKCGTRPSVFGFFSRGGVGILPWPAGIEELGRKSSLGAVGGRAGVVTQCALQEEGTSPCSAAARDAVGDIMAFFS